MHDAVDDVGLADEVSHKGVFGLVIDILGGTDLLDTPFIHDHDRVAHGEGLLLVVGDIDKGDAYLLLDALEFDLHILTQLEIQRTQRFVQQEYLGAVDKGTGDGNPLLLAAGEGMDRTLAVPGQVDQGQGLFHPLPQLRLGHFADAQTEGHVFKDVHVGEQGILLKDGIDLPLMRRNVINPHAVKKHVAGGRLLKAADDTERRGFAAPGGTEQREEFLVVDIKVDMVQNDVVVKFHEAIRQADQFLGHVSSPISKR